MTSKNDVLKSILTYFCQKSDCSVPCQTPPLPLGFTAITDPLKEGEVPPGSGSQFGAAPVKNSSQFPVEGRIECGGWRVLSRAHSLALTQWTAGAALI